MMINNISMNNFSIIEDYQFKEDSKTVEEIEKEFEIVDRRFLQDIKYPSRIQTVSHQVLKMGSNLDYITCVPGVNKYVDTKKIKTLARVCKLPSQVKELKKTFIEIPKDNPQSFSHRS